MRCHRERSSEGARSGGSATRITWCAQSLSGTLSVSPRGGVNEHAAEIAAMSDKAAAARRTPALIFFQVAGRSISVPCVTPPKHGAGAHRWHVS